MQIMFVNQAAADVSFSVQWDGGQTGRTPVLTAGNSATLDMTSGPNDGTSCWARAYVQGGPNHDSGDNFTYTANSSAVVVYTLTGGVDNVSFSMRSGEASASKRGMVPEAARKTGLFLASYTIASNNLEAPVFAVSLAVNTVDKAIDGAGRITQPLINPPLDLRTRLHGSYTSMTVMPDRSHILVVLSGEGAIGTTTTLTGTNVELRMMLSSDWSSGTASYSYVNQRGAWVEVSNVAVRRDG